MYFFPLRINALDNIIILCRRFPESAAVAIHLAPRAGWLIGGKVVYMVQGLIVKNY